MPVVSNNLLKSPTKAVLVSGNSSESELPEEESWNLLHKQSTRDLPHQLMIRNNCRWHIAEWLIWILCKNLEKSSPVIRPVLRTFLSILWMYFSNERLTAGGLTLKVEKVVKLFRISHWLNPSWPYRSFGRHSIEYRTATVDICRQKFDSLDVLHAANIMLFWLSKHKWRFSKGVVSSRLFTIRIRY